MKMMKTLSLVGILSASACVGGAPIAFAADTNADSQAKVEIQAPTNPDTPNPPIVGPGDPDNPGTGQTGPLTLDYVSNFDFGTIEVGTQEKIVDLQGPKNSEGKIVAQGLQVTDVRGTGVGWKVNVQLSEFKGATNTANQLRGAELRLPQGSLVTQNESNTEGAPVASAVNLEAGGAAQTIFKASQDQGMGTWFDKFDPQNVKLRVPSAPKADKYTATLTATLSDTPA